MTIIFEPPPTYADVVLIDPGKKPGDPGFSRFNPIWLKWFVDAAAFITANGGSGTSDHNQLSGLQGGSTNQYYHFTGTEHSALVTLAGVSGISATVPLAKLTGGGANGSLTFLNGLLTARVDPT